MKRTTNRIVSKKEWKIVALSVFVLLLISLGTWANGWYAGKVAPSKVDTSSVGEGSAVAYFAGGCFWCTESDYEKVKGVTDVVSGYMGGSTKSPSYKEVASGESGHREVVKVTYNPMEVSYRRLALELLRETDPTDGGGSFYDRGHQYTSAIYYQNDEEKRIAEEVIKTVEERGVFDTPIVTDIEKASTFWLAEEYHQDYHKKSALPYTYYRNASGRDAFIESVWGTGEFDDLFEDEVLEERVGRESQSKWEGFQKPNDTILRQTLTPLQYYVTQQEGTEKPFENEYWDNHEEGLYVDIVSGEPLFSSTDKFDSGTGWPSFLKPIEYSFVTEHDDRKLFVLRTEIRSRYADSHLGHIILDGPIENDNIRYCMNSASLRFIPKEELEAEGLGEYRALFS